MSNTSWPTHLHLDLAKSNWEEWSFQLCIQTNRLGFTKWLRGTLPHPSAATHPKAHDIWETNDCSLRAFIFSCISQSNYIAVESLATSHLIFKELCLHHEKLGPYAQLLLIKKALDYHYDPDAPLHQGADEILALHTKITKMGTIDFDQLKIIFLINAFGDQFDTIQSSILTTMDSPSFVTSTRRTQSLVPMRCRMGKILQLSWWHVKTSCPASAPTAKRKDTLLSSVFNLVAAWQGKLLRRPAMLKGLPLEGGAIGAVSALKLAALHWPMSRLCPSPPLMVAN